MTIQLPFIMCCDVCQPKKEAEAGLSKKSSRPNQRFRDFKSDRWKCQQLWLSKYGGSCYKGVTVKKHVRVRNYLHIAQEVVPEYRSEYSNKEASLIILKKRKESAISNGQEKTTPTRYYSNQPSFVLETLLPYLE